MSSSKNPSRPYELREYTGHVHSSDALNLYTELGGGAEGSPLEQTKTEIHFHDEVQKEEDDESRYPSGLQLALITLSLFVAIFLVAISQLVIATAIPTISDSFQSFADISWYSIGEQVTAVAVLLPFGRAYTLLSIKWTFVTSVNVYLLGSAICGSAPSSIALIIGRMIQGVGMAGVFDGAFIVLAYITPLRKRSLFAGIFGAAYGIASVLGPVIVNLPIGLVIVPAMIFCLPKNMGSSTSTSGEKRSWWQSIKRFDPLGTILLLTSLVCLTLALEWGGEIYAWRDAHVVAALTVFAATILPWIALQHFQGEEATIPWSMVSQRSVAGSNLYLFFLSGSFAISIFFLQIWFQSVQGDTPQSAGLKQLALCLSTAVGSVVAGGLVMLTGYYNPYLILGSVCATAGCAIMMIIDRNAGFGLVIGVQILIGAGVGAGGEQANVAVQAVLPSDKLARGTSLTLFVRLLGFAMWVPVAQSIIQKEILEQLGPELTSEVYGNGGAGDLHEQLEEIFDGDNTPDYMEALNRLNYAITRAFVLAMILAAISLPFAMMVEWRSVKTKKEDSKGKKIAERHGRGSVE
ncbi:uncharacterized protein PpBr36_09955 [Pyricularia pennisetigena]|uniref:uncharacterized protein n=1 Tax=Pyricularia pennisetigena TaxID=1578925 RepID=UPI0011501AEE|nr:uncharacterized protein PpBr36_09955 [Pyricularia pennisetigena]TLS22280.1 hypothetical protein PpBr36_09955 [Pyricularia pennisetigena]